mgnify:CR=1 FL=1
MQQAQPVKTRQQQTQRDLLASSSLAPAVFFIILGLEKSSFLPVGTSGLTICTEIIVEDKFDI